ncbi:hypothetical protein ABE504_11450 [Paenibacillus oryzisoli]
MCGSNRQPAVLAFICEPGEAVNPKRCFERRMPGQALVLYIFNFHVSIKL